MTIDKDKLEMGNEEALPLSIKEEIEEQLAENQDWNENYAAATNSERFADPSEFTELSLRDPELYEDVLAACQEVIDPELGIDIYNLGLIYDLLYDGDGHLWVRMTLTMPGCPLADVIFQTLMDRLREIELIQDVKVALVWQPVWSPDRLTRYARIALGLR